MFEQVQGQCTFETVEAVDLIDAANTLKHRRGHGGTKIVVPPPGDGVDKLLNWAIAEVKVSAQANNTDEQERFAASAITNARRALGCLVDWYMQRDGFSLCKNAPAGAERKSEILVRRGLIDELTSHVLARAIAKRDMLEHQFVAPAFETAEDVVELLRRTIRNLMAESNPQIGPCLFGYMSHSFHFGKSGDRAVFYGWSEDKEPNFIFCTFAQQPRLGIIIPTSKDRAEVRRSFFNQTDVNTLFELLSILEETPGHIFGATSRTFWRLLAKEAALND